MIYAPVLIITLCRYDKLKSCLKSLSDNIWANKTTVYVALDYPSKEEHWEGYNKICILLESKFNFEKLIVIKRNKNLGPYKNGANARDFLFNKFDRIITSEDDNVFSKNFLEYMNKCLDKYENDKNIMAICGHLGGEIINKNSTVFRSKWFSAWGVGWWKCKFMDIENFVYSKEFKKEALRWNVMLQNLFAEPKIFVISRVSLSVPIWFCDVIMIVYLGCKYRNVIIPTVSKVRNIGIDESGVTASSYHTNKIFDFYKNQKIDEQNSFSLTESDECNAMNQIKLSKIGKHPHATTKIKFFKQFIRYLLYKFFGYDLKRKTMTNYRDPYRGDI